MRAANQHSAEIGIRDTCAALEINPATYYRHLRRQESPVSCTSRPRPPLALSKHEVRKVLDTLHSKAYVDLPPQTVVAKLLDKGQYLCSCRTMYRILAANNEVRERRRVRKHTAYAKPELIATAPNQVWVLGYHKAQRTRKMDLLPFVSDSGYLQSVCGWLVDRRS
jgi:putative transposase